jgi:hypothetical protein
MYEETFKKIKDKGYDTQLAENIEMTLSEHGIKYNDDLLLDIMREVQNFIN